MAEIVRPAWSDPRYALATNTWSWQDFSIVGTAVTTQILVNNPKRWAFGILSFQPLYIGGYISPFSQPDFYGWKLVQDNGPVWFGLFEYGPIVTSEWYLFSMNDQNIRVVEVTIQ